jgi:hypothetical protein
MHRIAPLVLLKTHQEGVAFYIFDAGLLSPKAVNPTAGGKGMYSRDDKLALRPTLNNCAGISQLDLLLVTLLIQLHERVVTGIG